MHRTRGLRASLALALAIFIVAPAATAAYQDDGEITRQQVDDAFARRNDLQLNLDDAVTQYQQVYGELESVTYRAGEFRERILQYEKEIRDLREVVQERAVAAYMNGSLGNADLFFGAGSLAEIATGQEFLSQTADRDVGTLNRLSAVRNSLDATRTLLEQDQQRLASLESERSRLVLEINDLFTQSDAEYRTLRAGYDEQERLKEEEARRRRLAAAIGAEGAAAGATEALTPGFICPFDPPYSFYNDWGAPRSGDRTHKGTDVVTAYGHPMKAVADGVMYLRTSELGGTTIWLDADYGTSYYYAHLSAFVEGAYDGMRVSIGQVIGYTGDSGNARGGVPHLHFQVHPGGRGSAPVNPYPTLVRACG